MQLRNSIAATENAISSINTDFIQDAIINIINNADPESIGQTNAERDQLNAELEQLNAER